MLRKILTLVSFSLLTACTPDEIQQARDAMLSGGCPPLVLYDKEFQRLAAESLRKLAKDDPLVVLVADYKKMRDACRAAPS